MFYILADFLTPYDSRFPVCLYHKANPRPSDTDKSPDFEAKVRCASLYWSAPPTVLWSLGLRGSMMEGICRVSTNDSAR